MRHRVLPSALAAILLLAMSSRAHAVTFSGRVATDFPAGACITDPSIDSGGQDVQFVVAGAIRTSGFDAIKLCILYDAASDTVQVGTLTHNNAANTDIITGDADGNGDPATVSSDLSGSGIQDIANFGPKEFFSLLLDFDFSINNGFSIVAGKNEAQTLVDYNVFTAGSASLDDTSFPAMYGAAEGSAIGSSIFTSPSSAKPHLEFIINHFKSVPGLTLDWSDPNDMIGLYFTMGSYSDGAIGEEIFPSKLDPRIYYRLYPLTVAHLLQIDADGDGVIDDLDTDDDGDGIPDLIELGIKSCDLDGDGILSVSQDANSNGLFDAGEEGEILKCSAGGFVPGGKDIIRKAAFSGRKYPDFDDDGTPNYLDTDSDGDSVLDKDEDKNGNGVVDSGETNPLDTDSDDDGISDFDELQKFKIDTDGDGLSDGEEVETYHTDPDNPDTDADELKDGDEVKLYGTDPLKADTDGGGARDGLEVQRGTNPLDPSDDQKALIEGPESAVGPGEVDAGTIDPNLAGYSTNEVHLSGSGLTSCSLFTQGNNNPSLWIIMIVIFCIPAGLRVLSRGFPVCDLSGGAAPVPPKTCDAPDWQSQSSHAALTRRKAPVRGRLRRLCRRRGRRKPLVTIRRRSHRACHLLKQRTNPDWGLFYSSNSDEFAARPGKTVSCCRAPPVILRNIQKTFRATGLALVGTIIMLLASPAHALNVQRQHLPINGYGGLFQDNTQMLGQYHWNMAAGFDYTLRPLQFSLITSGTRLDNVVDYFATQDTSIAFGLADWLDIGISIQSNLPSRVESVGATAATTQSNFGDFLVSAKFQLLDPVEEKYGLGLALIPFVTLPTGKDSRYFGNDGMTGGFKVVGERYFGRTDVYATLGARFRGTENLPINLSVGSELLFGVGAQHPISMQHDLHILGEFDGSTTFSKFMHQENTSPVEMNGGLRKYWWNRHLAATVSIGTGIDSGYGSPRLRAMAALSFLSDGVTDRDEDGVRDPEDYCPTQIMDAHQPGPRPGCPDPNVIVKVVGDRILILRPINFETGSALITADSMVVVDQVAQVINKTPDLQKVLVEGHTDNVGGPAYNQKLSDDRAKSVVDALVARSVTTSRLTSRGWGLTKPITTNTTESGRAKNRRVEFHIVEMKKQ